MKLKKAQSVLESTLAYAAGMMVLGAAMAIWGWGNAHIPVRQITYEVTRPAGMVAHRNVDEHGAQESGPGSNGALWPTYFVGGGIAP